MYDRTFWNDRYATPAYIYGTDANSFLSENVQHLSSPVLSLCEGEGRNAVFLATQGLQVLGVDCSEVGLEKARALAKSRGVVIETELADLAEYQPQPDHFGSVVSISAHLPSVLRARLYPLLEKALQPNGVLLLEAYTEQQLTRDTGGPKNVDMLMSVEKLRREFPNLKPILLRELDREVSEGVGHTGLASVVQFLGKKQA